MNDRKHRGRCLSLGGAVALLLSIAILSFGACSSSASVPTCQNPTAAQQSCNACSGSSCSAQVNSVIAQCTAYVTCYEACDCSDASCLANCGSVLTSESSACVAAGSALALCETLNCPDSECAPDAGPPDASCRSGQTSCAGGCVDLKTDPGNCGACDNACPASMQCISAACECPLNDESICGGECVDESNDPYNCGGCGIECAAASSCVGGSCACTGGATNCDGTCVDQQTDVANCGGCGLHCPTATAGGPITCQAGKCGCPTGKTLCGGTFCVETGTDPMNCGGCGVRCPATTPSCVAGACIPTPVPNCAPGGAGLSDCGATKESCCTSLEVTGGTFYRTYDPSTDAGTMTGPDGGATGEADPATVSTVKIDKYLVTVGRFRQFVNAWNDYTGYYPAAGSGIHTFLNDGKGLVALPAAPGDAGSAHDGSADDGGARDAHDDARMSDASADGQTRTQDGALDAVSPDAAPAGTAYESGWVAADDSAVAPTDQSLACDPLATWTPTAGSNENLPVTCVTWQEAYAFCIWDGGFLPSEAEWEYAAAGGSGQLEYPWGSAPAGTGNQFAIYGNNAGDCYYPTGALAKCAATSIAPVGTATHGAGLFGQLDMAGEVQQWTLDGYAPFADPSVNAAYLGKVPTRSLRGSNFGALLAVNPRADAAPTHRLPSVGFRCARAP